MFQRGIRESASQTSHHTVAKSVCLGWGGGVMFISTVKMPEGTSRRGVSEGERGGGGVACMEIDQCAVTVHLV